MIVPPFVWFPTMSFTGDHLLTRTGNEEKSPNQDTENSSFFGEVYHPIPVTRARSEGKPPLPMWAPDINRDLSEVLTIPFSLRCKTLMFWLECRSHILVVCQKKLNFFLLFLQLDYISISDSSMNPSTLLKPCFILFYSKKPAAAKKSILGNFPRESNLESDKSP